MPKRRKLPNGFGSIEKVEKTTGGKKRVNQYRARLPAKKGRKDIGFYKTRNEAFEALRNYKEPVKTDTFKALYMKFRNTNTFKNYSKNTQNRYDHSFERFQPFHDREIHTITYSELQEQIDQIALEGYTYQKDGQLFHEDYSKYSIGRLKHLLNKIFTLAIRDNLIEYNPVPYLEINGELTKRQKEIFNHQEIENLYQSIPYNPNARHVLTMIFTGLRTGEYLYLKKSNINLEQGTITDFGIKTETGKKRIMYIHPKIYTIVKDLYQESKTGYIVEYQGKTIKYDKQFYDNIYYPALDLAKVKRKIPYSCRYTFATILYYSKVDPKVIQKLMGHSSIDITDKFYIQDKDNMKEYIYKEFQKIS